MTEKMVERIKNNRDDIRLLIDSGAFTDWKAGKVSSVEDYMKFLDSLPIKPWRYFVLDKIGDPEGTRKNYEIMKSNGFNPVPIFTRGTDLSELDSFYEDSDLVGIGGLVGTNNSRGYLKYVVERNKGRPLHWLGVTEPRIVNAMKPYSCDSSAWSTAPRYGNIQIYIGGGKFVTYNQKKAIEQAPDRRAWQIIRSYGLDPKKLQEKEEWINKGHGRTLIYVIGIASYVRYSRDVEERFGTKMFLVASADLNLRNFLRFYKRDQTRIQKKEVLA